MKTFNEKGFSSLAAAGIMIVLSILGFSIVSQVTTSHTIHSEQIFYDRSFYVNQSGLEYAMRKIYDGSNPVVESPGIAFGGGTFTISRAGRLVTVTSLHSGSSVVHSVTSPTQADCTRFDVSRVELDDNGEKLKHLRMRKICLEQIVLDKITASWTNPGAEGLKKVKIESDTVYDNPPVPSGETTELADYIVLINGERNFTEIVFSNDMTGRVFTFNFRMGDGSQEAITFAPDDD